MENKFVKLTAKQAKKLAEILENEGFARYDGNDFVSYYTKVGNDFYSMTEKCWNHIQNGGGPDIIGTYTDDEGVIRYGLIGMATVKVKVKWSHS